MPLVTMSALNGDTATIATSDPERLAGWLMEWLPRLCAGHPADNQVRLTVYPLLTSRSTVGPDVYDWPVRDAAGHGENWTPAEVDRVVQLLHAIASDRRSRRGD